MGQSRKGGFAGVKKTKTPKPGTLYRLIYSEESKECYNKSGKCYAMLVKIEKLLGGPTKTYFTDKYELTLLTYEGKVITIRSSTENVEEDPIWSKYLERIELP
jgi:hypothetical protein